MLEEKLGSVELDLSIFDRKILEYIITESCEKDISVNKVIENLLINYINSHDETRDI